MKIFYINNDGGGFAASLELADGTTVGALFAQKLPDRSPEDILIRVNRLPATADHVLVEGDRVSFTATKIAGAVLRCRNR